MMNDDLMGGAVPPVDDEELEEGDKPKDAELDEDDDWEDDEEEVEKVKPAIEGDGDVSLEDLGEEETKKSNTDTVDDEGNPQF